MERPEPTARRAGWALVLAAIGPFVMAASSPAAVVLGWRVLRTSLSPRSRGRAAAAGAIALGTFGLLFWTWAIWRLWVRLDEQGRDASAAIPLAVALIVVWTASALAAALTGRNR
jgi:hypothetical protein